MTTSAQVKPVNPAIALFKTHLMPALLVLLVSVLWGCSDGSDSNSPETETDTSNDDSITEIALPDIGEVRYAGKNGAATITQGNVPALVAGSIVGRGVNPTATRNSRPVTQRSDDGIPAINQLGLAFTIFRSIHLTLLDLDAQNEAGFWPPRAADIDIRKPCDHGSVHITGTIDNTGPGSLILEYSNCRSGNEQLNGVFQIVGQFPGSPSILPSDALISFISVGYANLPTVVGVTGEMRVVGSFNSRVTVTIDEMSSLDIESGKTTKLEDTLLDVYNGHSVPAYLITASGRVYDPDIGYFDFSTDSPFELEQNSQGFPDRGELRMQDATGANLHLYVISSTFFILEFDLDNDKLYERVLTLTWEALVARQDINDSDGDGIYDDWETANGLDPGNPADAGLDFDLDLFSNRDEYHGNSDPNDDDSTPLATDFELSLEVTGDPATGSLNEYKVEIVGNGGVGSLNPRLVTTLPEGAMLVGYKGSTWNCFQVGVSVICDAGYITSKGKAALGLSIKLPDTSGSASIQMTLSTEHVDANPSDNEIDSQIFIHPRLPSLSLDLGGEAFDTELDSTRNRFYVSLPQENAIAVVSLSTFEVIRRVDVGSRPNGIDMSADGNTLYVALNEGSALVEIDLASFDINETVVAHTLESVNVYDVFVASLDSVFASAGGIYGQSSKHLLRLDPTSGNALSIAGQNSAPALSDPVFASTPGSRFLYTAQGSTINKVNKFDLQQPGVPLVQQGNSLHSVPYVVTRYLAVSPDETRIFLSNGIVLEGASLSEIMRIEEGVPHFGTDPETVLIGRAPNKIAFFEINTLEQTSILYTSCRMENIYRIFEIESAEEWLLIGDDMACKVTSGQANHDETDFLMTVATSNEFRTEDAYAGKDFYYSLQALNQGPTVATDVTISFELSPEASIKHVSGGLTWNCSHESGIATCTKDVLDVGEINYPFVSVGLPAAPATITATTSISSSLPDSTPDNNTVVTEINVIDQPSTEIISFAEDLHDFEVDSVRQQVYASIPYENRIVFIDLASFTVTDSFVVGGRPMGISQSPDGSSLYFAISDIGMVGVIDLDSHAITTIPVATELGSDFVFDIIAPRPGEVFVSANTSSSLAYLAKIDTLNGNLVSRLHGDRVVRSRPSFTATPNPQYLYLSRPFYKFDLTQPGLPIVQEADRGFIDSGDHSTSISNDGSLLKTNRAQLVRTEDFTQKAWLDYGSSYIARDSRVTIASRSSSPTLQIFDLDTLRKLETVHNSCDITNVSKIVETNTNQWLMIGDQRFCRLTR